MHHQHKRWLDVERGTNGGFVDANLRGGRQRAVNVADDSELRMGDYFDLVADRFALARPPRVSRSEASALLSPTNRVRSTAWTMSSVSCSTG